ncbi:hypothetical protein [uncultured Pseudophaeobacter sp.]|jgi:hypothetical protein|nr:hypothetical protein [uncultured Pseudophaeobacter sp.]
MSAAVQPPKPALAELISRMTEAEAGQLLEQAKALVERKKGD